MSWRRIYAHFALYQYRLLREMILGFHENSVEHIQSEAYRRFVPETTAE